MKKSLLFIFLVVLSMSLNAQSSVTEANHMKSGVDAKKAALELEAYIDAKDSGQQFVVPFSPQFSASVLSENTVAIGSSGNLYTILRGTSNMVDADESLNTVVFLHRNNPFQFGESTSQYRYDISTDGGNTFESDLGPLSTIATGTNVTNGQARYPQVAIQDNGTVENSFLTYWGATHDGTSSNVWDGTTWGVAGLNNDPATFTTGATVWNNGDVLIPNALVKGLDGEFWANDIENFGANVDGVLILYKGVMDASDPTGISWEIYQTFDQMYETTTDDAGAEFSVNTTVTMGFSPDGMQGYMMALADGILPGYAPAVYAPYVWTTNDGGVTWDGPSTVDIRNFEGFVQEFGTLTFADGTVVETDPCFSFYQPDMVVDANGDAHMTCLLNSQFIDQGTNEPQAYSIYGGGGVNELVDVVYSASNDTWMVHRFGDGLDATILVPSDTVVWDDASAAFANTARVQASRNEDGSKVFFTWLDSEPLQSAGDFVAWRDMKGVGLDVTTGLSSPVYNFTAESGDCAGKAFYSTVAPHVLVDGDTYKIPAVFTEADVTAAGSDLGETFFHYFQGATIGAADFTVPTTISTYADNPPLITELTQSGVGITRDFTVEGLDPEFTYAVTWDFGDGSPSATGTTVSHDFPNGDAVYSVEACAENYDGISCALAPVIIGTVEDNVAPEIVLTDGETLTVEGGLEETYQVPGYSATDQIGEFGTFDVTDEVIVSGNYDPTMLDDYTITYTVTDAGDNITTVTQTVTVVDTEAPSFEAAVSTDRELCVGDELPDVSFLFTITDAFIPFDTEDFTEFVNFDAEDMSEPDVYEIDYTAVDPNGNESNLITVTYTVCACDAEGECVDTGIEDLKLSNAIALVPNPTSGIVNMTVGDVNGQFTVEVYDVQGKEFLMATNYSNSNVTLNLTDAPSGVYFVKVETTDAVAVKRIIVE